MGTRNEADSREPRERESDSSEALRIFKHEPRDSYLADEYVADGKLGSSGTRLR